MTIHTRLFQDLKITTSDSPIANIENIISKGDIFLPSTILPENYYHPKNTTAVYAINYIEHNGKIVILDERLIAQPR